ncbi:hypothetical protein HK104_008360 [Borealophlyctis nickersoniae]|nr:hypothetical protein HK104_008360 [Borealophlyctis nickersoniae]
MVVMHPSLLFVATLLLTPVTSQYTTKPSTFQTTGKTVIVNGVVYYIPPVSRIMPHLGTLRAAADGNEMVAMTVLATNELRFTSTTFESLVKNYTAVDDVFATGFLKTVYLRYTGPYKPTIPYSLTPTLKKYSNRLFMTSTAYPVYATRTTLPLPAGPYFVSTITGDVFQAYRLYSDENQAFLYGTVPAANGGYAILSASVHGAATATVGVPSRLYFTKTSAKPLAGVRMAVKDIYDVKGLKTGCGNRAYYDFYPAKTKTAFAVQRLIDMGAVVVGKVKTSQFANGESPTADWVDFHSPFNPRGEGYQNPSSSSSGSGAAVASYPWLDIALGSDTGGSMRGPVGSNGLFGNRPSHGAVSFQNVMPLGSALDTAGVFARDAKLWRDVGKVWYTGMKDVKKYPKKIIFPTDYWTANNATPIFEGFISKLETFLSAKRENVSLANLWATTKPAGAPATPNDLLSTTYAALITIDQVRLLADPFINAYAAAHGGRKPFINPVPLSRWTWGRALPAGAYEEGIKNKTMYMDWWSSTVTKKDAQTCSDSLVVYPQSAGFTSYRNQYGSAPGVPLGFSAGRISVHAEIPDMVIPLGELPYTSTITGQTEYLPVTISIMATKDCDLMLFNLIADLQSAGIVKPVKTGARMY